MQKYNILFLQVDKYHDVKMIKSFEIAFSSYSDMTEYVLREKKRLQIVNPEYEYHAIVEEVLV